MLKSVLLVGALVTTAPVLAAESMPPALDGTPAASAVKTGDPGFNADVEVAIGGLTRLQCKLLDFIMIRQPSCQTH